LQKQQHRDVLLEVLERYCGHVGTTLRKNFHNSSVISNLVSATELRNHDRGRDGLQETKAPPSKSFVL
jgi:hypothetical protein